MPEPGRTAIGTWSGGRFMHFGEEIDSERLQALLRPGDGVGTLITADTYGQGEADSLLGRALEGTERDSYSLVGAVGHDFYEGERQGAKGFPRFTDPSLRGPGEYASYLRMAAEHSLGRIGADTFDLLLLHNPDRTGYESEHVWDGMTALREAGLTRAIGVAPGPANGFTLDLLDCLERYGDRIDWAMVILNPLEPWPGELALEAAARNEVRVITRVVDYGGLFWGDLRADTPMGERDHRRFRPDGWIEAGRRKLEQLRPLGERAGLSPIQLACAWNLSHPAVACAAPTLIQESGGDATSIEEKRRDLADLPENASFAADEIAAIREIGDNTGSMRLKGANPEHVGPDEPDRWALTDRLIEAGRRFGVEAERDLVPS